MAAHETVVKKFGPVYWAACVCGWNSEEYRPSKHRSPEETATLAAEKHVTGIPAARAKAQIAEAGVYVLAAYEGVGEVRDAHGRVFRVAGETYTAMEFAEHIRRKFFPEDTLEEDIDGSLFPKNTFYFVHNTLLAAGHRVVPEHERPTKGKGPTRTHARPKVVREVTE